MKNIMSVDLEDYYCDLPFSTWPEYESRVIKNTQKILNLFEKHNINATFFSLGYIAEKHPELIEKIKSNGHEIASHGYSHTDLRKMTKESLIKVFIITCIMTVFISSIFWSIHVEKRTEKLGQAICEEAYDMDFDGYAKEELYCKPAIEKELYDANRGISN